MTRYKYEKTRKHSLLVGPFKELKTLKKVREKTDRIVIELIVAFLIDKSITQGTAYGVISMEISGVKEQVNRVVRNYSNAVLVQELKVYLSENGIVPPSDRTLYTYLDACVASKSTILRGLDNSKEALLVQSAC